MVLPLPVFVLRDLGSDSFFNSRRRNLSFRAFITGTDIVQVLVAFQIWRLHLATAIEIVAWY